MSLVIQGQMDLIFVPMFSYAAGCVSRKAANTYDEFPYPGRAFYYTHPDRLCACGVLHGLTPAPVENCRVLELGCGDGGNIMPMAYSLPGSQFFGIDLANAPIATGNERARQLGLSNLKLQAMDILDFPLDAGPFDYIIAHGVFSWVPVVVREKLLAICGAQLAPHGVAYISYQTQPGSYGSTIVHEMMRYQATRLPGATVEEIVRAGMEMLRLVIRSTTETDMYRALLTRELNDLEKLTQRHGGYSLAYHDVGVEISEPVTFFRFMEQAGRHALQFLCEVRAEAATANRFTPSTMEFLQNLRGDVLAREQYKDFLTDQNFRRTLLCQADAALDHSGSSDRVRNLYASGCLQSSAPLEEKGDLLANEDFVGSSGAKITVNQPVVKTAFRRLEIAWPTSVSFEDLLSASASADTAPGVSAREEDAKGLATTLLALFQADLISLTTSRTRTAPAVSERPVISALVRQQIERGLETVTNLGHGEVQIKAVPLRQFLSLLDGTRDRATILRDWQKSIEIARLDDPSLPTPKDIEESLDAVLQKCIQLQLMVG